MTRIAILGSTGSIGTQTLDVVRQHPERLHVRALAAHSRSTELLEQARQFGVHRLALYDVEAANRAGLPGGMSALLDLVTDPEIDLVVVSVAGMIGLEPTLAAIDCGKRIALASKEVLVAAGSLVMPAASRRGIPVLPIDSEHSAIFQCLQGAPAGSIDELILTASGGPFRGWMLEQMSGVTRTQALNHPTWAMGGKITIDSATLMNKGLELIEAHWLFDVPVDRVTVVVHPQSILHSMVRFTDGSVLGQMGWPNMRLPIQYALLHPERPVSGLRQWDPVDSSPLTFERPDLAAFPCLRLAIEAATMGGDMPCVMNAANEVAANAFLDGRTTFPGIANAVSRTMEAHAPNVKTQPALADLLQADAWARETAARFFEL